VFVTRAWFVVCFVAGCSAGTIPGPAPDAGLDAAPSPVVDAAPIVALDAAAPALADAAPMAVCVQRPLPVRPGGTAVELPLEVLLGGKALVFGEPNPAPGGGKLTPLNLRFFVSHLALTSPAGDVPVDLLDDKGHPLPYGVQLYNAEEGGGTLRALAPPGSYSGLSLTFGLDDACNLSNPHDSEPPLTDDSQMTWPHEAGFLFLRYEAQLAMTSGVPDKVHMGGRVTMVWGPTVRVAGALVVPPSGKLARPLRVRLDEIFRGAAMAGDTSAVIPLPEVQAGERLRQNIDKVAVFELGP
jgi:hypothetical protein